MKKVTLGLALLPMYCLAQQDSNAQPFKHRFEILADAGVGFKGGMKAPVDKGVRDWKNRNYTIGTLGVAYYVTRRINAGVKFNSYKWHTAVSVLSAGVVNVIDGYNRGYSLCLFGNYCLPFGNNVIYAGLEGGRSKSMQPAKNEGFVFSGYGADLNIHLGYEQNVVSNRLYAHVEAGRTRTTINLKDRMGGVFQYVLTGYPVVVGLNFSF